MRVRLHMTALTAIALHIVLAAQAFADPVYWGSMQFDGFHHGRADAGECMWSTSQNPVGKGMWGAGPDQFLTFCVEVPEKIYRGVEAYSFINTESSQDHIPLAAQTAFLYTQFLSEEGRATLGYVSDNDHAASMQLAIWYFQHQIEGVGDDTQAQAWVDLANDEVNLTNGGTWGDTIGNIRILNNWTNANQTGALQDMLVATVPLPAPIWMGGLGLFGVIGGSVMRRRAIRSEVDVL